MPGSEHDTDAAKDPANSQKNPFEGDGENRSGDSVESFCPTGRPGTQRNPTMPGAASFCC